MNQTDNINAMDLQTGKRREILFTHDNTTYVVNVAANEIRERGYLVREYPIAERVLVHLTLSRAVRRWIDAGETEYNMATFCQDVLLLWHFSDYRTQLRGDPDLQRRKRHTPDANKYLLHVERPNNFIVYRMICTHYPDVMFYIYTIPAKQNVEDPSEYRRETFRQFKQWISQGKNFHDTDADVMIGRVVQLWHLGDPEVHIEQF